jgi:hypothetical protein
MSLTPATNPATAPGLPDAQAPVQLVGIVDDDPLVAGLALELCEGLGVRGVVFGAPSPFLKAFEAEPPGAAVIDWRLERELGAAVFMAARHRFPTLRLVCWTGTEPGLLPAMVRNDPLTVVVDKASGIDAFNDALRWALGADESAISGGSDGPVQNP